MSSTRTRARHRRRPVRRAFTLLEIIVVVTIIAILATLVAPKVISNIWKSKQKIAKAEVSSLAQQVQLWMVDNGYDEIPDEFELAWLTEGDSPYIGPDDLLDPWENPFVVLIPGEKNPNGFDIISYGADGEPGGSGKDNDIIH
jgi:general secretion pathway protein G